MCLSSSLHFQFNHSTSKFPVEKIATWLTNGLVERRDVVSIFLNAGERYDEEHVMVLLGCDQGD